VPNYVRGRVFSSEFALFTLFNAAGTAAGGWALDAQWIIISDTFWWMTVLTLVPGLLWTFWIAAVKPKRVMTFED
jgi:hypothetical protein